MAILAPRSIATIETSWLKLRAFDGRAGWVLLGALWLVTRLIYLLNVTLGHHYPDDIFIAYGQHFSTGLWPYRDFPVEYPPLGIALVVLPGLIHSGPLSAWLYSTTFGLEMLALDLLTLWLVIRLAKGLLPGDPSGLFSSLLYTGFVAASGAVAQKFDLVAGMFCLVAVLAFIRRQDRLAWVMLVLATMTKGFPLAIAPLFIAYRLMEGRPSRRALLEGLGAAALSSAALLVPLVALVGLQPLIHSVVYHVDRGVEIESMYAGAMLLLGRLPGLAALGYYNPADLSQDIHSPLEPLVNSLATPLGLLLMALVYWQFYRAFKPSARDRDGALARAAVLVLLAFIITFRALPGHYLLAILPLAAVIRFQGRRQTFFVVTLLGALLLGQLETVFWQPLLDGQLVGILALVLRNGAILACGGVLLGGQLRRFAPQAAPALAPQAEAAGSLVTQADWDWAVESGVRSWQEVSAPFDSYRQRSASLLTERHLYFTQQRNRVM